MLAHAETQIKGTIHFIVWNLMTLFTIFNVFTCYCGTPDTSRDNVFTLIVNIRCVINCVKKSGVCFSYVIKFTYYYAHWKFFD